MTFLENKLIIIPYNLPQNWVCDYLEQTSKILSQKNWVVKFLLGNAASIKEIFLKKIKKPKEKFIFFQKKNKTISYTPIHFLPFKRFRIIENINILINIFLLRTIIFLTHSLKNKERILWLFDPQNEDLVGKFKEKLALYDCVDFYSSLDPKDDFYKKSKEKKLFKKVNIVFVNSPVLQRLKKKFHPKVYQVPQGCAVDLFFKAKNKKVNFPEFKNIKKPIIGFVGNINYRLDFKLIKKIALKNSSWQFVFVGPIVKDDYQDKKVNFKKNLTFLKKLPNVHFLKRKPKWQIPFLIDLFDICWIPYDISQEFNRYCYPMKVFEYFAKGKPVISTPIESLIPLQPYLIIASNTKDFEKKIKRVLENDWSEKYKKEQRKLALINSWEKKLKEIDKKLNYEIKKI